LPLLAGDRHWGGSYQCTAPGTDGEAPLWSVVLAACSHTLLALVK
jgi:hypothetical protein